jgi:elongation factor P--(R)-beta-lysine ligase
MNDGADWRPGAAREQLVARARLLARVREFFATRGVLEVDTPTIVNAAVSDVHIHSAVVEFAPVTPGSPPTRLFLHTSPEYAMKRLLAAGVGDIYQVCHVARALESGRVHNPEFTLLEWYRVGFSLGQLMDEVELLVRGVLGSSAEASAERLSYREVFLRELGLDPFEATTAQLARAAAPLDLNPGTPLDRDGYLELLMGSLIGPRLGKQRLTFIYGYPASQAALARLDPVDPRSAYRFELYARGIELANGFHELAAPAEQRARFEADNAARHRAGLPVHDLDERLLAALASGLPDCAGVALGLDRLLMLASGARHIDEVLAFPTRRA